MTFRIRLLRPFGPLTVELGDSVLSTQIDASDADALLCQWEVYEELFTFRGPTAWFTAEPRENSRFGVLAEPPWAAAARRADPRQLLYPAHPDIAFRVPHVTHVRLDGVAAHATFAGTRLHRAAALIRNSGGRPGQRWPDIELRNRFATADRVDLFGPGWVWGKFRSTFGFWKRSPAGYQGDAEAAYLARGIGASVPKEYWPKNIVKVELLSRYHAAICLENTVEPFYFSEKFVDGVLAGCVPIYRAHPTVRDGVLKGARWVDPADFGLSPNRTLAFALSLDREAVAEQNRAWLETEAVCATEETAVWRRIATILRRERGNGQ